MNLTGKILIVLILLSSTLFLWVGITVYASHQNWEKKAMENKDIIEAKNRQIAAIQAEINKKQSAIETEKVARAMRISQLESQYQASRREVETLTASLNEQRIIAQEQRAIADQNEKRLAEQDKNIADLETRLRTLTEDVAAQREKVIAMTNQIFELEGERRNLENIRQNLAAQNATLTKVLKKNGLTETSLVDHIPPAVEGRVYAVDSGTIAISVGHDDGMRVGHKVDIFRGERFVGTAEVTVVEPNRSAARVDRNLTKFAVETGDRVTTHFILQQK